MTEMSQQKEKPSFGVHTNIRICVRLFCCTVVDEWRRQNTDVKLMLYCFITKNKLVFANVCSEPRECLVTDNKVFFKVWPCWPQRCFERPQLLYPNSVYFDGGSKASFYCIFEIPLEKWRDRSAVKEHWPPQVQANFWGCEGILPGFSQTCPKNTSKKVTSKKINSSAIIF